MDTLMTPQIALALLLIIPLVAAATVSYTHLTLPTILLV